MQLAGKAPAADSRPAPVTLHVLLGVRHFRNTRSPGHHTYAAPYAMPCMPHLLPYTYICRSTCRRRALETANTACNRARATCSMYHEEPFLCEANRACLLRAIARRSSKCFTWIGGQLSVRSTPEVNTHPTRHALAFEQFPGLYTVLLRSTCGHTGGCLRVYVAPAAKLAINSQVGGSTAVLALIERVPCFITLCASKPVRHVDDRSPSLRLPLQYVPGAK